MRITLAVAERPVRHLIRAEPGGRAGTFPISHVFELVISPVRDPVLSIVE